ncbi:MAG: hypothetical protein Q8L23_15805 [Caulobacter sp.]|nr:hypothetical protein [Caulobacter sp.]
MTRYGPGGHVRKYRPPVGGGAPGLKAEPRCVPEHEARRLWRAVCAAAMADAGDPDAPPQRLTQALSALGKAGFPLAGADMRLDFVRGVEGQMRAFARAGSYETRRAVAGLVIAGAGYLERLLLDQGADIAAVARARMGQRDD